MLESLGIAASSWYHDRVPPDACRPRGPKQTPVPREIETAVLMMATNNRAFSHDILHSSARVFATTSGKTSDCTVASLDSLRIGFVEGYGRGGVNIIES